MSWHLAVTGLCSLMLVLSKEGSGSLSARATRWGDVASCPSTSPSPIPGIWVQWPLGVCVEVESSSGWAHPLRGCLLSMQQLCHRAKLRKVSRALSGRQPVPPRPVLCPVRSAQVSPWLLLTVVLGCSDGLCPGTWALGVLTGGVAPALGFGSCLLFEFHVCFQTAFQKDTNDSCSNQKQRMPIFLPFQFLSDFHIFE